MTGKIAWGKGEGFPRKPCPKRNDEEREAILKPSLGLPSRHLTSCKWFTM